MNTRKALQYTEDHPDKTKAGKWFYANLNKRSGTTPYGVSMRYVGDPEKLLDPSKKTTKADWLVTVFDSEKECLDAQKEYVLNEGLNLNGRANGLKRKCLVCGEFTQSYAHIQGEMQGPMFLCDDHRNRYHVETFFEYGHTIISS